MRALGIGVNFICANNIIWGRVGFYADSLGEIASIGAMKGLWESRDRTSG